MANLTGSSTAEIDAPRDLVWALVQDVESAPEWQGGLKWMHALERDGDGRATLLRGRDRREGGDGEVERPLRL